MSEPTIPVPCGKRLLYLRSAPLDPTTEPQTHHYVCSWCGAQWSLRPDGQLASQLLPADDQPDTQ